jgi:hypothetical protein
MSLEYALTQSYVSDATKEAIQKLIDKWVKPDINSKEFIEWSQAVITHFGGIERGTKYINKWYPEYNNK